MRALHLLVLVALARCCYPQTASQSEILQLQSVVSFLSCECSDSTKKITSSWCHCDNPYILPRKFAAEPTNSFRSQTANYSRDYVCTEELTDVDDGQCQWASTFQAIEYTRVSEFGEQYTEQQFLMTKPHRNDDPAHTVWVQKNSNSTLSDVSQLSITNATSGNAWAKWKLANVSKQYVNTWPCPVSTGPTVNAAPTLGVLRTESVIDSEDGSPGVLLTLSTINPRGEASSFTQVDQLLLPDLSLSNSASFAVSHQLSFFDVKNGSSSSTDLNRNVVPDRAFLLPVQLQSTASPHALSPGAANADAIVVLQVLWEWNNTQQSTNTSGWTPQFDQDVLVWALEFLQSTSSTNSSTHIVDARTATHNWGCRVDGSNSSGFGDIDDMDGLSSVSDNDISTVSATDQASHSSEASATSSVPTQTPAWWGYDASDVTTPSVVDIPVDDFGDSFVESQPLDFVSLMQGYDPAQDCTRSQQLVFIATQQCISTMGAMWPILRDKNSSYSSTCQLSSKDQCPPAPLSRSKPSFQFWHLTSPVDADNISCLVSPAAMAMSSSKLANTSAVFEASEVEISSIEVATSHLPTTIALGGTSLVNSSTFSEEVWLIIALNPNTMNASACIVSVHLPWFGYMDETLSNPGVWSPWGAEQALTTARNRNFLHVSDVMVIPFASTNDIGIGGTPLVRRIVGTWREFSLDISTQYEEVCNITNSEVENVRSLGSTSPCNEAVLDSLDLRCSGCSDEDNSTIDDGGLNDLLSGQFGARHVFFVVDTANRVHIVQGSSLKTMIEDLMTQVDLALESDVSLDDDQSLIDTNETHLSSSELNNDLSQEYSAKAQDLKLTLANVGNIGADVSGIQATPNGQYLFVTHFQKQSSLRAMERAVELCAYLSDEEGSINTGDYAYWYDDAERLAMGNTVPTFSRQQCLDGSTVSDPVFGGSRSCASSVEEVLHMPSHGDFVSVLSACEGAGLCSSFSTQIVTSPMPAGKFTRFGFDSQECVPGCYCQSAVRTPCELGFKCSDAGLSLPDRCTHDSTRSTTCYERGLTAPTECSAGTLCVAPYAPAIPAAPGFMQSETVFTVDSADVVDPIPNVSTTEPPVTTRIPVSNETDMMQTMASFITTEASSFVPSPASSPSNPSPQLRLLTKRVLIPCPPGYYCNLGRSDAEAQEDLLCPASTYCRRSTVIEPVVCDQSGNCTSEHCDAISYCPAGSMAERLCPAGHYCTSPDGTDDHVVECELGSYCPAGSVIWEICTAGFYCPDPTQKLLCTEGSYCPEGSTEPTPCGVFEVCEAGAEIPQIYFSVLVLGGVPVVGIALCVIFQNCLLSLRSRRHAQRLRIAIESSRSAVDTPSSARAAHSERAMTVITGVENIGAGIDATHAEEISSSQVLPSRADDASAVEGMNDETTAIDTSSIDFTLSGMSPFTTLAQHKHRARTHSKRRRSRSRSFSGSNNSSRHSSVDSLDETRNDTRPGAHNGSLTLVMEEDMGADIDHESDEDDVSHELSILARAGVEHRGSDTNLTVDLKLDNLSVTREMPRSCCSSRKIAVSSTLLENLSGQIKHGEMTAVMGPSGSGKTLFLSALAGKIPSDDFEVRGVITVNGCHVPAHVGLSLLSGQIGFVPKDDTMMRTLSVKENLMFSARSRLSRLKAKDGNTKNYVALVEGVIDILGLYNIRHNAIGDENTRGISGGQRKRVNIGIELVSEPTVLLLDEPTSGLDATCAAEVCSAMKALAKLGLTIVSVIHQPRYEIYRIFDRLILLQIGGRCEYFGDCRAAELHFTRQYGWHCPETVNPADFLIDSLQRLATLEREAMPLARTGDGASILRFSSSSSNGHQSESAQQLQDGVTVFDAEHGSTSAKTSEDNSFQQFSAATPRRRSTETQLSARARRDSMVFRAERHVDRFEVEKLTRQLPPRRPGSGPIVLFSLCFWRSILQQTRSKSGWIIDNVLVFVCALFLGLLYMEVQGENCSDCAWMSAGEPEQAFTGCSAPVIEKYQPLLVQVGDQTVLRGTMCMIAMGITSATSAMRVFQTERREYFRENSRLPKFRHTLVYFFGKDAAFLHQWAIGPLVFVLVFHSITVPRCSMWEMYLPLAGAYYCGAGLSYLVCLIAPPNVAQELAVVLVFGFAMFAGGIMRLPQLMDKIPPLCYLHHISFLRYVLEAFYVAEANEWADEISLMGTNFTDFLAEAYNYSPDTYGINVGVTFVWGLVFRLTALGVMAFGDRAKKL